MVMTVTSCEEKQQPNLKLILPQKVEKYLKYC